MPPLFSAGLVPFRSTDAGLVVFLVHMSGPFWAAKEDGAWSIAKGEYIPGEEEPRQVARREFMEEVGRPPPHGTYLDLGETRMRNGKRVRAFAVETDEELSFVASNLFTMEWPPGSGHMSEFPEVDRADWFTVAEARVAIVPGQQPILEEFVRVVPDR
jgi:predicted NUDIX family NTP pyrophosphohydrolase